MFFKAGVERPTGLPNIGLVTAVTRDVVNDTTLLFNGGLVFRLHKHRSDGVDRLVIGVNAMFGEDSG